MNQARAYYKAQLNGDKIVDNPIADFVSKSSSDPIPEPLDAICEETRAEETSATEEIYDHVITAKEDVKSESKMKEFQEKMEEEKKKTKLEALDRIDKAFDKLIEYGDEHPEQQDIILKVTEGISKLIITVWDALAPVLEELAKQLWDWLKKAYEWIKDNFGSILQTIVKWVFIVITSAAQKENALSS